jgi:hypothetical protein
MNAAAILGAIFLLLSPLLARADHNPDFNQDAKPILRMQPHLLDYVSHTFDVRDTGLAKVPGDETRRPMPPFIFQARPRGSSGAYFITLLIQPGPEGHILKVVDPTRNGGRPPDVASGPAGAASPAAPPQGFDPSASPEENQPGASSPPPAQEAPPSAPDSSSSAPSGPTSDTPSGPLSPAPTNSANLAPPPDPAPAAQ